MRLFFESLLRRAEADGDALAISSPGLTLTYAALIERVRREARWLSRLPGKVGCLFSKSPAGIVGDLAMAFAGKHLIPLPDFFSDDQLKSIGHTAQVADVVTEPAFVERVRRLGFNPHLPVAEGAKEAEPPANESARIIFTSGTTGTPKGVQIGSAQMTASIAGLAEVSQGQPSDRYLSVLPHALLLEQIAGIYVPLSVGASIHLYPNPLAATPGQHIAIAAEQSRATTTVLVPELLKVWLNELELQNSVAPDSLRFIAVGGAPVPTSVAATAWRRGLPAYEGYGLSECCSVVAANSPLARRPGTVGKPLPGLKVDILEGEIVVSGPTVMEGYVGGPKPLGPWRTGDLGHFDEDGFLIVSGRKDNVIVTAAGRNVSPEWIEQAICSDTRVTCCAVVESGGALVALLVCRDGALRRDASLLDELVATALEDLPQYAKPKRRIALSEDDFRELDLVTANGRLRRSAIADFVAQLDTNPLQIVSELEQA